MANDPTQSYLMPRGMFRSRKWLDLAHECERCQNCGRHQGQGCEPAHSNLPEHGKGVGQKAHDCLTAFLCEICHRWLDNRGGYGKDPSGVYEHSEEGKREMFTRAMVKSWLWLVMMKKLVLA